MSSLFFNRRLAWQFAAKCQDWNSKIGRNLFSFLLMINNSGGNPIQCQLQTNWISKRPMHGWTVYRGNAWKVARKRKSWTSLNYFFELSTFILPLLVDFIYVIKIYVRSQKRVSGNRPLAWEHAPQWGKKSKKQGQIGKISASEASPAVAWGGGKGSPIFSPTSVFCLLWLEWIPQNQVGHLTFITQRYNLLHAMRI